MPARIPSAAPRASCKAGSWCEKSEVSLAGSSEWVSRACAHRSAASARHPCGRAGSASPACPVDAEPESRTRALAPLPIPSTPAGEVAGVTGRSLASGLMVATHLLVKAADNLHVKLHQNAPRRHLFQEMLKKKVCRPVCQGAGQAPMNMGIMPDFFTSPLTYHFHQRSGQPALTLGLSRLKKLPGSMVRWSGARRR